MRSLFTLKKEKAIKNRVTGDIRSLFNLRKENKEIKNRSIGDIRILFEHQEENYHEPVRVNCTEYERNGDRNKTLSVEEYLRPYLKDINKSHKKNHK